VILSYLEGRGAAGTSVPQYVGEVKQNLRSETKALSCWSLCLFGLVHRIHQSVLLGFLCSHEEITVNILLHPRERLT
jgi:hypothetical protein